MRLKILAVGTKMPSWVGAGVAEYEKRLPREYNLTWHEIPPAKRQGEAPDKLMAKEAEAIERHIKPGDRIVALDPAGMVVTTEKIAAEIEGWQMEGGDVAIIIGGPDGIAPELLAKAQSKWSFGRITLPHPLVRVVLAEQLYRAWSINAQHPYHRG